MNYPLKILFFILFLISVTSRGHAAWGPLVSCPNVKDPEVVLEMSGPSEGPPYYRLRIKNPETIDFLKEKGITNLSLNFLSLSELFGQQQEKKVSLFTKDNSLNFQVTATGQKIVEILWKDCQVSQLKFRHGDCKHVQPYGILMSGRPGPWCYFKENESTTNPGRFYPRYLGEFQIQWNANKQVIGCYDDGCCQ